MQKLVQTVTNLPAVKARQAIPPAKRRVQVGKTLLGGSIFVGGLFLPKLGYPYWAGLGMSAFGAFISSQQLVFDFLKGVAQFVQAIGGKVPETPPVEGRGAKAED